MVLLSLGGYAQAQDDDHPPFTPPNAEVNKDLDKALDSEYNRGPLPSVPDAPGVPAKDGDEDDNRRHVQLRIFGAYWHAQLSDLEISHRDGTSGGEVIKIEDPWDTDLSQAAPNDDDDFEGFGGGIYRLTLDLGKHVALSGSFSHMAFDHDHIVGTNGLGSFTYGNTTFNNTDQLSTDIELYTGDFDLILRPINVSWVTIDITIGGRYVSWKTELTRNLGSNPVESDKIEALVPAAGLGLTLRPVSAIEIFIKGRYGALSYEVDEHYEWDDIDNEWDKVDNLERDSETIEADVGVSLILGDTIGITLGYRFEYFELERITDSKTTRFAGETHGLYAGAILQF